MFGNRKPPTPPSPYQPTSGGSPTPSVSAPNNAPRLSPPASPNPLGFETVIGAHTTLKGDLHSAANARIDGEFEGSIHIDGNLMVGETAHITANIEARNLAIAGTVHGNITGNKVQIQRTGRIWGDISASAIVTEDGAFLEGKITMAAHPAAQIQEPSGTPETSPLTAIDELPTDDAIELESEDNTPTVHITLPDA